MKTIYLDADLVPQQLRGAYSGKKFKAVVCEQMTVPADAGFWSGGSRETFQVVRAADGQAMQLVDCSRFGDKRQDIPLSVEPGFVVVRHSIFCGKDTGLTLYVHPADVAKLLPSATMPAGVKPLSDQERATLDIVASYKSSYRLEYAERAGMNRADYDTAKAGLIMRGLLNKGGAITNAGRNALAAGGAS